MGCHPVEAEAVASMAATWLSIWLSAAEQGRRRSSYASCPGCTGSCGALLGGWPDVNAASIEKRRPSVYSVCMHAAHAHSHSGCESSPSPTLPACDSHSADCACAAQTSSGARSGRWKGKS
jgi:hypothetical protein